MLSHEINFYPVVSEIKYVYDIKEKLAYFSENYEKERII